MEKNKINCNVCNVDSPNTQHKKIFYEPIVASFYSTYSTLTSVACGMTLGAFFFIIVESDFISKGDIDLLIVWQCLIVFVTICFMWHSYIDHAHFLAWPIGFFDTLIPLSFSALIAILALSISNISQFTFVFNILTLGGYFAFGHATVKINNNNTFRIYVEHFHEEGPGFARCILENVRDYEIKSKRIFLYFSIVCCGLNLIICGINRSPNTTNNGAIMACSCFTIIMVILITQVNLRRFLAKNTCLRYGQQK